MLTLLNNIFVKYLHECRGNKRTSKTIYQTKYIIVIRIIRLFYLAEYSANMMYHLQWGSPHISACCRMMCGRTSATVLPKPDRKRVVYATVWSASKLIRQMSLSMCIGAFILARTLWLFMDL